MAIICFAFSVSLPSEFKIVSKRSSQLVVYPPGGGAATVCGAVLVAGRPFPGLFLETAGGDFVSDRAGLDAAEPFSVAGLTDGVDCLESPGLAPNQPTATPIKTTIATTA